MCLPYIQGAQPPKELVPDYMGRIFEGLVAHTVAERRDEKMSVVLSEGP